MEAVQWVQVCAGSSQDRTRIWVAAAITEGSDGHSFPASPKSLSGAAGALFWVRNASNPLSAVGLAGEEGVSAFL